MSQKDTRSESDIEKTLGTEVRKLRGLFWKLPSKFYRGIPDRLVLLPGGRVYFLELKTSRGVVSEVQKKWIAFLCQLGFDARVVRGTKGLKEFLDEVQQFR